MIPDVKSQPVKLDSLIIIGAMLAIGYLIIRWIKRTKVHPDNPWGSEIEAAVQKPDAILLCHRCFTPQENHLWFCPKCGASTGPYNNYMPYVYIFPQGEVLRMGATMRLRQSALIIVGYMLLSLSCYAIFAPFYWYRFFKNLGRQSNLAASLDEADDSEIASTE